MLQRAGASLTLSKPPADAKALSAPCKDATKMPFISSGSVVCAHSSKQWGGLRACAIASQQKIPLQTVHSDVMDYRVVDGEQYDHVVLAFFLCCFSEEEREKVLRHVLTTLLKPGGRLTIVDHAEADTGPVARIVQDTYFFLAQAFFWVIGCHRAPHGLMQTSRELLMLGTHIVDRKHVFPFELITARKPLHGWTTRAQDLETLLMQYSQSASAIFTLRPAADQDHLLHHMMYNEAGCPVGYIAYMDKTVMFQKMWFAIDDPVCSPDYLDRLLREFVQEGTRVCGISPVFICAGAPTLRAMRNLFLDHTDDVPRSMLVQNAYHEIELDVDAFTTNINKTKSSSVKQASLCSADLARSALVGK
ncbi:hypothetical protein CYMTET_5705 [Cymbomonas tetramitiformis]|uniref:Uncharacterized protein n=1 Tax=Cymbomonas tetramitiformis TaxID=36881 RepID=A0AAE0GYP0_9CHLO|nr:hypothetical protein CYMTET_5705 [Cymbomonas tetramitiformis]